MRCGLTRAVSSALLLTLVLAMPHHEDPLRDRMLETGSAVTYGMLISEFYPAATCGDEYIVVTNCGVAWGDLDGWSVTDGEGHVRFCASIPLAPGSSCSVSWNGTSYRNAFGHPPNVSVGDICTSELVTLNGSFRMSDSGDSLSLMSPRFELVDFVAYGSWNSTSPLWKGEPVPAVKRGEVVKRVSEGPMMVDSDRACDWTHFREFRYGYSQFKPPSFSVGAGNLTAFASPDSALDVLLEALDKSTVSISLCAYELSSVSVTQALLRACSRGVAARVFVDGSPVGGIGPDGISCLSVLSRSGVDVRTLRGNSSIGAVQHVGELHAKYLVVDHIVTIVMSENLVEQGVPNDRIFGNRGWGAKVVSAELAGFVERVFNEDSRSSRTDVVPWTKDERWNGSAVLGPATNSRHSIGMVAPRATCRETVVTVFVSPDCSLSQPYVCDLLESATSFVGEQFQADLYWDERWQETASTNPILQHILELLRRGGNAKVLFDSSWFNLDRNSQVRNSMTENGTLAGLEGEFALLDENSPIIALHNKGAMFDGRDVLISSNNWVYSSFAKNREMGLMISSCEAAEYFSTIFNLDWIPDTTPPIADAGPDITVAVGERALLSSNLSSDDRAIVSVTWDTDCDGEPESGNRSIEFVREFPGTFTVLLTVDDAWGNRGTDEMPIIVLAPDGHGGSDKESPATSFGWTVPLILAAAVLFARWRRGKRHPADARNLNHSWRA